MGLLEGGYANRVGNDLSRLLLRNLCHGSHRDLDLNTNSYIRAKWDLCTFMSLSNKK